MAASPLSRSARLELIPNYFTATILQKLDKWPPSRPGRKKSKGRSLRIRARTPIRPQAQWREDTILSSAKRAKAGARSDLPLFSSPLSQSEFTQANLVEPTLEFGAQGLTASFSGRENSVASPTFRDFEVFPVGSTATLVFGFGGKNKPKVDVSRKRSRLARWNLEILVLDSILGPEKPYRSSLQGTRKLLFSAKTITLFILIFSGWRIFHDRLEAMSSTMKIRDETPSGKSSIPKSFATSAGLSPFGYWRCEWRLD